MRESFFDCSDKIHDGDTSEEKERALRARFDRRANMLIFERWVRLKLQVIFGKVFFWRDARGIKVRIPASERWSGDCCAEGNFESDRWPRIRSHQSKEFLVFLLMRTYHYTKDLRIQRQTTAFKTCWKYALTNWSKFLQCERDTYINDLLVTHHFHYTLHRTSSSLLRVTSNRGKEQPWNRIGLALFYDIKSLTRCFYFTIAPSIGMKIQMGRVSSRGKAHHWRQSSTYTV